MLISSRAAPIEYFPTEFQKISLDLVGNIVPAKALRFYVIDPEMNIKGFVGTNVPVEAERHYHEKYWSLDPMNPAYFKESDEIVVCNHVMVSRSKLLESVFYKEFLQPLGVMYDVDVFFRKSGVIIAVLTLLRSEGRESPLARR